MATDSSTKPIGTVEDVRSIVFEQNTPHIKSRYYCLECGAQDVWIEQTAGEDYYCLYSGTCRSCGARPCCMSDKPAPLS